MNIMRQNENTNTAKSIKNAAQVAENERNHGKKSAMSRFKDSSNQDSMVNI